MRLRSISIENYRAIHRREISFQDQLGRIRPVTVLAGPNGCGKTSVLFAIVQALRGVMGYRTDDVAEPNELEIHRRGAVAGLSPRPVSVDIELDLEFDEAELRAIPQILEDSRVGQSVAATAPSGAGVEPPVSVQLPTLPDGRVWVAWRYPPDRFDDGSRKPSWYLNSIEPRGSLPWLYGYKSAIRGWRNRTLRSRELLESVGGIRLFGQDRNLHSRVLGEDGAGSIRNGMEDLEGMADDRRTTGEASVWGILKYLSGYALARHEPLKEEENWEKRIKDGFQRICAPKEYLGFLYEADDPIGAPYFRDGASVYPLNMAASGEQVIIDYLARLTYPSPLNHSLILIDEPEIHLHPRWIRQLFRALPLMGINNQFILTTHSLELRSMAAEDESLVDLGEMQE